MARSMNKPGIVVHIGTEYTDRDLKKAQADLRRLETTAKGSTSSVSKFGDTMKKSLLSNFGGLQTAVAGAVAGIGAFTLAMAVDGVRAAAQEEQQLARLKSALDNVNQGFALPGITEAIDRMMYATGVADDQLRPAFQTLVTATRDAEEAQRLLSVALDISVAKQRDLGSVATALAKASNGQVTALTRLGVPLSEGARQAGNFSVAVGELQAAFGGAAAANADTFAGKLQILQVAFEETKEAFGTGFLEGIESSLGGFNTIGDTMVDLQPQIEKLGEGFGELTGQVVELYAAILDVRESLGPIADLPLQGLTGVINVLGMGVDVLRQRLVDTGLVASTATDNLRIMGVTDFSYLTASLDAAAAAADNVARPRQLNIVVATRFAAGGVGVSDYVTRALDDYFEDVAATAATASSSAGSAAAAAVKKENPFGDFVDMLASEAKKQQARARLIAKGIPAAMADGILSDPGWAKIAAGVMGAGRDAVRKYVEQWTKGTQGMQEIGSRVDSIVQAARDRLDALRDEQQAFEDIRQDFAETARDFGAVTTLGTNVPLSAESITANLRQRLQIVRKFADSLTKLRDAGLGPAALADIIGLGPFEGLQYAEAILAGGAATIGEIKTITAGFVTPANTIATIGAEVTTGKTAAMLDQSTNFTVQAGGVQITVNGEVTQQVVRQIEDAVTKALRDVGRESRARGRGGVR